MASTQPSEEIQLQTATGAEELDRRIVSGILEGDPGSFEDLYNKVSPRIYQYGLRRLRNHQDAEDLTQEVFIRVLESLHSYEGRSRLMTWIFGIANFLTLRQIHARHRKVVRLTDEEIARLIDPSSQGGSVERSADATRLLERCNEVLEQDVSSAQRRIFRMMYAENNSMGQISEMLGIRTSTIKSSLRNTRRILSRRARNGKR